MIDAVFYGLIIFIVGSSGYAALKLGSAARSMKASSAAPVKGGVDPKTLPSVSVCIPARNETHAMTDCLERVLTSTYPKLEVIVLDDASTDNTPALIRSFASQGVRFIEGEKLHAGWLGKNHALHHLLEQASGKYVVFMDVDTRIEPETISRLVDAAMANQWNMLSVLPSRKDGFRWSIILSPLRYFWAIVLHGRARPSVSSSLWMVDRHELEGLGGIEAFKNAIRPEAQIARFMSASHSYGFVVSSANLPVSYEKKWLSQIETSIRILPDVFGPGVLNNLLALLALFLLTSPLVVLLTAPAYGWTWLHDLALALVAMQVVVYGLYTRLVWRKVWWIGALFWPFIIFQELIVLIISLYGHLTHAITWKGRKVEASAILK